MDDARYFEDAFNIWNHRHNQQNQISDYVEHFLKVPNVNPELKGLMLRLSREAQYLTIKDVAKKLKLHQSTLTRIEKSENSGNIKIKTMEKVAKALDCELIYCLRPKSRITFARAIWTLVCPKIVENKRFWVRDICIYQFAITVNRLLEHPRFRKLMKWNQRGLVSDAGVTRVIFNQSVQRFILDR